MIGLVLVSHSSKIVHGLAEMVSQVAPTVPVAVAGGDSNGKLGTDPAQINQALQSLENATGILVLVDLLGSFFTLEKIIAALPAEQRHRIRLTDAPLVEGALAAAHAASAGSDLTKVEHEAGEGCRKRM